MKIGIFGGAFNPIHNGHLKIATDFSNQLNLDFVLFIPTADPPHKSSDSLVSFNYRFEMVKLAISGDDRFQISDIEFRMTGKSYTYNTLIELKKIYPNDDFYLIMGADQFLSFDKWYRYKDIIALASICTTSRENDEEKSRITEKSKSLEALDLNRFYLSESDTFTVSSSQVRRMIADNQDVSALIPKEVYFYIKEKGIYTL